MGKFVLLIGSLTNHTIVFSKNLVVLDFYRYFSGSDILLYFYASVPVEAAKIFLFLRMEFHLIKLHEIIKKFSRPGIKASSLIFLSPFV